MDASSESGNRRRAAWQGSSSSSSPTSLSRKTSQRWQKRQPGSTQTEYNNARRSIALQRIGWTVVSLGLLLGFLWIFFDTKPAVPLILVVAPQHSYEDSIYGDSFGNQAPFNNDLDTLRSLRGEDSVWKRGTVWPIDLSSKLATSRRKQYIEGLRNACRETKGGGPGSDTAVIYISCVGAVNSEGQPCLVPPTARNKTAEFDWREIDSEWVPIEQLLQDLVQQEERPRNLVVVFDTCRPTTGQALGVLDGSFAAAFKGISIQQPEKGALGILVSAGPGETSCGGEMEHASVFTATFSDALEGCADKNGDGRVSFLEVSDYMRQEVSGRARRHHGRLQLPIAIPSDIDLDFAVSWTVRVNPKKRTNTRSSETLQWAHNSWQTTEKYEDFNILSRPTEWAELQHTLLRAEQSAIASRESTPTKFRESLDKQLLRLQSPFIAAKQAKALPGVWLSKSARQYASGELEDLQIPTPAESAWQHSPDLSSLKAFTEDWEKRSKSKLLPIELQSHWLLEEQRQRLDLPATPQISDVVKLLNECQKAICQMDVRADKSLDLVQDDVELLDRYRRRAYDLALVDPEASQQACEDAKNPLQSIQEIAAQASQDWTLLNRTAAELPWLVLWWQQLTGVAQDWQPPSSTDWKLVAQSRNLLTAWLSNPGATRPSSISSLDDQLKSLRKTFDEACHELITNTAENPTTLAELRCVLTVPLVPATARQQLIKRERELTQKIAPQSTDPVEQRSPEELSVMARSETGTPSDRWLRRIWLEIDSGWVAPDAFAFGGCGGKRKPTTWNEIARYYGSWGQQIRDAVFNTERPDDSLPKRDIEARMLAVVRGGCSLAPRPSSPYEHCSSSWHNRMVTLAGRTVDDYLSKREHEPEQWYSAAARSYLDLADQIGTPASNRQNIENRLRSLLEPILNLEVESDSDPQEDNQGFTGKVKLVADPTAEPLLPTLSKGIASFWLESKIRAESTSRRQLEQLRLPISFSADTIPPLRFSGQKVTGITARAWFRGHLKTFYFDNNNRIVWKRDSIAKARITVEAEKKQPVNVTFILDCSGSMNPPNGKNRLAPAITSLYTILGELAKSDTCRASVWLYGHRFKEDSKVVKESPYFKESDNDPTADRNPDTDVQQIRSMNDGLKGEPLRLKKQLAPLWGWGQTPLYLALVKAIEKDGGDVPSDAKWKVVVLTDGVNRVLKTEDNPTSIEDVQAAWKKQKNSRQEAPTIDFIALDITPGDEAEKLRNFVTGDLRGNWLEASDESSVTDAYRNFLDLAQWEILDANNDSVAVKELGETAENISPGSYKVHLAKPSKETPFCELELKGGELFELVSNPNELVLWHKSFDGNGERCYRKIPIPGSDSQYWRVAGYLAKRKPVGIVIPLSFEKRESETRSVFSPRPEEFWVEVRPVDSKKMCWVFTEPPFARDKPVPYVNLTVPGWPSDAKKADVRIWFSPDPAIESTHFVSLDEIQKKTARDSFDDIRGVKFSYDLQKLPNGYRLVVSESHNLAAAEESYILPAARLSVQMSGEPCRNVRTIQHAVDNESKRVKHVFDIDDVDDSRIKNMSVKLISRENLKRHCFSIDREESNESFILQVLD